MLDSYSVGHCGLYGGVATTLLLSSLPRSGMVLHFLAFHHSTSVDALSINPYKNGIVVTFTEYIAISTSCMTIMALSKQTVTEMSVSYLLKGCPLHVVTCRPNWMKWNC